MLPSKTNYDKLSVENLSDRDRDYENAMEESSKRLLASLWNKHPKQLEYALKDGRQVIRL